MKTFVEPKEVETQIFDWGRIQWLSEPRVTGSKNITAGVVTLEPAKDTKGTTIQESRRSCTYLRGRASRWSRSEPRSVAPSAREP
jgi:hypothetical protein